MCLIANVFLFALCIREFEPCIEYCGIQTNVISRKKARGRIINAQTLADKHYSWMVSIQKKGLLDKRFDTENLNYGISRTGGAIITANTIITCGHCICNNEEPSAKQFYAITCPEDPKNKEENLNKKDFNEIYITTAQTNINALKIDGKFDKNLKAYLYNYEKNVAIFSNNGDIGIVITKIGVGKWSNLVGKICLPTTTSFQDGITVKIGGWGNRYDQKLYQSASKDKILSTSCQTNEARSLDRNIVSKFDRRVVFLDCETYEKDPTKIRIKKCNSWLLDTQLETLPLKIDLPQVLGVTGLNENPTLTAFDTLDDDKEQKRCVEYLSKARKAWAESGELKRRFDNEIDRIVIKKFKTTIYEGRATTEEVCFNLKKVAKYGVCSTKKSRPGHWGFCSRSCYVSTIATKTEPYEIAEFKYFENAPGKSDTKFKRK